MSEYDGLPSKYSRPEGHISRFLDLLHKLLHGEDEQQPPTSTSYADLGFAPWPGQAQSSSEGRSDDQGLFIVDGPGEGAVVFKRGPEPGGSQSQPQEDQPTADSSE